VFQNGKCGSYVRTLPYPRSLVFHELWAVGPCELVDRMQLVPLGQRDLLPTH